MANDWTMGDLAALDQYGELVPPDERGLQPQNATIGPAEMRSYEPSWAERIKGHASDLFRYLGADPYNAGKMGDIATTGAAMIPPVGFAFAKNELERGVEAKDPYGAALALPGLIPGAKKGADALRAGAAELRAGRGAAREVAQGFAPGSIADQATYGVGHNRPPMQGLDFWGDNPDPAALARTMILPGDTRVSTRFPKAVQPTLSDPLGFIQKENPLRQHLSVGFDDMMRNATPEQLAHNMGLLSGYPGFKHLEGMDPAAAARAYVDQTKGNLNHIWQGAPEIMRQRSPLWYEGAHEFADALSARYGIPRPSASGGVAVLSPQKDWLQNASLGERVGDIIMGAGRKWDPDMMRYARASDALGKGDNWDIVRRIAGKPLDAIDDPMERAMWVRLYDEVKNPRHYRDITPEGKLGDFMLNDDGSRAKVAWGSNNEISKAIQMFESNGNMDTISRLLGGKHKVRSFYNNIENPNDLRFGDVTSDTHQVAGGQLRPLSGNTPEVAHNFGSSLGVEYQPKGYKGTKNSAVTGLQGTYPLQVAATQELAKELNMVPRAVQSGVWEPVRTLFTDTFKANPKNTEAIDNIWRAYDRKEITLDEARRRVVERAGGFEQPSWARSGSALHDPKKASTYR